MKPKYIAIIILLVLAVILVFWQLKKNKAGERPLDFTPAQNVPNKSLGSEVYEKQQNPVKDEIPSGNPFEQSVNPIDDSYSNPFGS